MEYVGLVLLLLVAAWIGGVVYWKRYRKRHPSKGGGPW